MKLEKIKNISIYKSFKDFNWQVFFNNENFHDEFNVLYGENGSGKSSICNILKNVCLCKSFGEYIPQKVILQFNTPECNYTFLNRAWDRTVACDSIIFFDREFIQKNIHLGHDRGRQQGQQEQESGKMIIQFDSKAIELRRIRDDYKNERDAQEEKVKNFSKDNQKSLEFSLTEQEYQINQRLSDKNSEEINKLKIELKNKKHRLEELIEKDQKSQNKVESIQTNISEFELDDVSINFPKENEVQSLFSFDLKVQTEIKVEKELIEKIKSNKEFFDYGFKIRKEHSNKCPFCQTTNEEDNIKKILNVYNQIYDIEYIRRKKQFESLKLQLVEKLRGAIDKIDEFDFNPIFYELKKLDSIYQIENIYSYKDEKLFKKTKTINLIKLLDKVSELQKPSKENISQLYKHSKNEIKSFETLWNELTNYLELKNSLIVNFKLENTDEKIKGRLSENNLRVSEIDNVINFIDEKKHVLQIQKEKAENKLKELKDSLETKKENHKKAREDYEIYCSGEAFVAVLRKIEGYFENFNFNFKLELDIEKRKATGLVKEYPFAFKVFDINGNPRDFKEGLSEGEMQVLSLCFFFAFLEIQKRKKQKILVFDDPITSLDNNNLSCLVDLLASIKGKFSQTFIFTHHRTFFKFLRKKIGTRCKEYIVIRNQDELGGSFICGSKNERFVERLKGFEEHLNQIARRPGGFDLELKIVEYGQYLRYEIERFIKNDLLYWHADTDFSKAIDGIKKNKKITNNNLDKIKSVYSFCNWTTSHVDVGDDYGLSLLKEKINDFISVTE